MSTFSKLEKKTLKKPRWLTTYEVHLIHILPVVQLLSGEICSIEGVVWIKTPPPPPPRSRVISSGTDKYEHSWISTKDLNLV